MIPEYTKLEVGGHTLAAFCLNPGASGEPVIMLHGITGTIFSWKVDPAKFVLDMGPCYALSLPGHFPAIAPADFNSHQLTAESMLRLLRAGIRQLVGDQPATLIGHSTGGFSVLALAANFPEITQRIVSISGFSCGRWTGMLGTYQDAVRRGFAGEAFFKLGYRSLMLHPALYRWAMRFYAADSRALYANPDIQSAVDWSFPSYRQLDLDAMVRYFKDMPDIDVTSHLKDIRAKTLLIVGDHDPIVPPQQSYQAAELIPGATLAVIKGAGHLPFLERTADYTQSFSQWLERTK
jgi:pimeloyl-ACP methyl ester carboxylesterase